MKKKIVTLLLVMALAMVPMAAFAAVGLENFRPTTEYIAGQYSDVKTSDWFSSNVATATRLGLLTGTSADKFTPNGYVTRAQAVTIAARIHSIYYTGEVNFTKTTPWYKTYADYCKTNNILLNDFDDYNKNATRAEFAYLLGEALPEIEFTPINSIAYGDIPDVPLDKYYTISVYNLYKAGILTGSGDSAAFKPDANIKRSEMAAIVTRMTDTSLRRKFTINGSTSKTTISVDSKAAEPIQGAYKGFEPAPDFGSHFGVSAFYDAAVDDSTHIYAYRMADLTKKKKSIGEYDAVLSAYGFSFMSTVLEQGYYFACYVNSEKGVTVYYGLVQYEGTTFAVVIAGK